MNTAGALSLICVCYVAMAWIRLSDDYNDHPKFDNLSDGAFRLWHQGMSLCRKFQTDGLIPLASVRKFKAYSAKRMTELMTPWSDTAEPLWHAEESNVRVHDYLEWNLSKAEESKERGAATVRMRNLRRSKRDGERAGEQVGEHSPDVPGTGGNGVIVLRSSEREHERKPSTGSRWPIFKGARLVVFDWMLAKMQATVGAHADEIEWDSWLDEADQRAMREPVVAEDWWPWLQAELLTYARTQGWLVAVRGNAGKQTTRLTAAADTILASEKAAGR
jgi:hypothetical protein